MTQRVGEYEGDESVITARNLAPNARMHSDAEMAAAKAAAQEKQAMARAKELARVTARARWKQEHPPRENAADRGLQSC